MKKSYIQIFSILLVAIYGASVAWLYWAEPKSLGEVSVKAKETVENVTTRGQVVIGTYEVDQAKFNEGLQAFRADNFVLARDAFAKADPERRDAKTQYYIAYSFYRQGWGRVSNDDELFKKGLDQTNFVIQLNKNFKASDENLKLQNPVELKDELEEGLKVSAADFNPLKVLRERK
ncbi:MAG: hypothetical protein ABIP06_01900 [Pyrinomonadaceae bacterium]